MWVKALNEQSQIDSEYAGMSNDKARLNVLIKYP